MTRIALVTIVTIIGISSSSRNSATTTALAVGEVAEVTTLVAIGTIGITTGTIGITTQEEVGTVAAVARGSSTIGAVGTTITTDNAVTVLAIETAVVVDDRQLEVVVGTAPKPITFPLKTPTSHSTTQIRCRSDTTKNQTQN